MRLYLSGPMTGIPEFNFPAFKAAREALRAAGHDVLCPAEANPEPDKPWEWYLRRDLRLLLDTEAVAVLPGWERSKGATLECHVAKALGMEVRPVVAWLKLLPERAR